MPNFEIEASLAGLIAGVFRTPPCAELASQIDDSKKLSEKTRNQIFQALLATDAVIAVAAASVMEIARLNILHASLLAMTRAVSRLSMQPDWALIDGNRAPKLACKTHCVIGGDALSLSIAAASIVAKVVRDRGMARLDRRWPGYGWATNAGYSTKFHLSALSDLGPTPHHRMGFAPLHCYAQVAETRLEADLLEEC